jgi:hypothetical protein
VTRTRQVALGVLVAAAAPLQAQDPSSTAVLADPQYVSYRLNNGTTTRTISQFGMPFAVILPFSDRFSIDISTSYANSQAATTALPTSSITGLTDTQVRGNLMLGDNAAVLTIGVNLPSGQYKVTGAQADAAGTIGNNFLLFPVTAMGSGLAATGGIGIVRPLGAWNLGMGASFRYATPFDPYVVQGAVLRYTPGNETRLRVGVDRPVGEGSFNVSLTYLRFGKDQADSTTFATGDRAIAQSSLSIALRDGSDLLFSAWDLYRGSGQQFGSSAPWENVADAGVSFGFTRFGVYLQPSVEERIWNVGGDKAGVLTNAGIRMRLTVAGLSINPSATYSFGSLYNPGESATDVTGFKASLLIRLH